MTVFIDTAVPMYAAGGDHRLREPCRSILRSVESGRLAAVTSAEVIQEILHRFVAIRRRELGAELAGATLDLFSPVLPVTHAVMARMPRLVLSYPSLSARDLVHVATCVEERIETIVSPDAGFDPVAEVTRVPPDDPEQLARFLR